MRMPLLTSPAQDHHIQRCARRRARSAQVASVGRFRIRSYLSLIHEPFHAPGCVTLRELNRFWGMGVGARSARLDAFRWLPQCNKLALPPLALLSPGLPAGRSFSYFSSRVAPNSSAMTGGLSTKLLSNIDIKTRFP